MPGESLWTRETPWRQGHVLPVDAVEALNLVHACGLNSTCVVVVSHDCDLANHDLEAEPNAEVIVGRIPATLDGNFSWAKSPRTLHFDLIRNGEPITIELVATSKALVPKKDLASFTPDPQWSFSGQSLSTLRSWLAVRYNRVAFPDLFESRLNESKVKRGLAKLIEPIHKSLSVVFFDVDEGTEIDRSDGSAYILKIVLVYPPGDDPLETIDKIDELVEKIEALFARCHYDRAVNKWNGVHLMSCIAISEDEMTVGRARLMNEWRYEHMSLKDEGDAS